MPIFRYSSLFGTFDLSLDPFKHLSWYECSGSRRGRWAWAAALGGGQAASDCCYSERLLSSPWPMAYHQPKSSALFPRHRFPYHKSFPKLAPGGPGFLQPGSGQMGILTSYTIPIQGPGHRPGEAQVVSVLGGVAFHPFRGWLLALSPLAEAGRVADLEQCQKEAWV